MGFILWFIPLAGIMIFSLIKQKRLLHIVNILIAASLLVVAGFLTVNVMSYGHVEYTSFGGMFYLDSLSMIMLDIVVIIGLMSSVYSIGYLDEEMKHGIIDIKKIKLYYILMYSFIFTMIFALTVKNMGVMWIAIEATTLASAFLVGFNNDKKALEAAWKYIIICSVGIAVALLGIIFLHLSSAGILEEAGHLDWILLFRNSKALNSSVLRLAFIFILIGFGTKAGLAPMHTWLPDAHSQSPSPISALLSGVLLNSAMYAIIRTVAIVNKNLGSSVFTGRILIAAGFLSIITSAVFILTQKDYKRLLAYSSIEHMGIIAIGIGMFTPLSIFGSLFHMINHSFTKSMLFLTSGNILAKYKTRNISGIRGLLKILPVSGLVFFLGLFAIAGTPPFSIFASEINVLASIFEKKQFFAGASLAILLAIVFVGIAISLFKIFHGEPAAKDVQPGETNRPGVAVIIFLLIIISVSGLFMPDSLKSLITDAQKIITGGPF
ncbi:MAG: hydrogenase 4 subunit F [Saccharofermentanales bacterium]